jgi:hypothetical protein
LGSSTTAAGERETEERERKRENGEVGRKMKGLGKKMIFFYLDDGIKDFNLVFCILVDCV